VSINMMTFSRITFAATET